MTKSKQPPYHVESHKIDEFYMNLVVEQRYQVFEHEDGSRTYLSPDNSEVSYRLLKDLK